MATVARQGHGGKQADPPDVWARRESIRATLLDARRVASKAASWLCDAELRACAEGEGIVIHVHDFAARCDYSLAIPVGLTRVGIAKRLVCELHSARCAAGCERWQMPPGWWLLA